MDKDVKAVVFDLDGVIVSTDTYHFAAWKKIADEIGVPFTQEMNDRYFRGSSRMECMQFLLESTGKQYDAAQIERYAQRKNEYYRESLKTLSPTDVLPGVYDVLAVLRQYKAKTAIASSSKNMDMVLRLIGMEHSFDATVGGIDITHSKPHPEVFEKAAALLETACENCLCVEDADVGLIAAKSCGMRTLGVGFACGSLHADESFLDLKDAFDKGYFSCQNMILKKQREE